MMNRIKRRMHMRLGVLLLAMMFTMQAFGRIVADTTWTGSPRVFIIMASLAGVCWIAFLAILMRHRRLGPVG